MDIGSILVIVALTVLVAAFVGRPLAERRAAAVTEEERRASALKAERDKILATIREMDLDFTMGKIDPSDYQMQRAALVARGAAVLREIDQLPPQAPEVTGRVEAHEDLEAQIEAEIARHRAGRPAHPAGFCPHCGRPIQAGDKFCVHCGKPVAIVEAQA